MDQKALKPVRNSSLELLRILCMFFIVFHHFMLNCAFPKYEVDALNGSDVALGTALTLNGFFCIAVNCFILITGYFGLKFKVRGFFKLFFVCAFYALLGYLLHLYLDGSHIGRSVLDYSLFALSNSRWWFINCYLVLFFTAPLLNIGIEQMTKKEYLRVILLLTIINVYFGFFGGRVGYNQYGYCVAQFVYLYVIGGYLRRFVSVDSIQKKRWVSLALAIVFSLLVGLEANIETFVSHSELKAFYYNNPLVVIASVFFFLFIASFHFHSKVVNWLATGAVAVYLFQEQPYIGYHWLYPSVSDLLVEWKSGAASFLGSISISKEFAYLFLLSFVFVLAILLFDHIRALLMIPVWRVYDIIEHRLSKHDHSHRICH